MNTSFVLRLEKRLTEGFEPAPPLSAQLLDAGRMLADRITRGEYAALTVDDRCDLRTLSMQIVYWSEVVETMELEQRDAEVRWHLRDRRRWRLGRFFRRAR